MIIKTRQEDIQLETPLHHFNEANEPPSFTLAQNPAVEPTQRGSMLLHGKFITHNPKAGINPLVDAAAYLFSSIGKLKQLKIYRNLAKLQKELIEEVNIFQEAAKESGYNSEYILVSRYALCATIDDIIANTPWGNQGQWNPYNLQTVFNQETAPQERFFLILERLIKDPSLYIDVMEFMYICLSLGYKGSYRSTEFSNHQLEKITHSLYKHIRAFHGDYSKTLSPFQTRAPSSTKTVPTVSYSLTFFITASIIMLLFIGLSYMLDTITHQAYKELMYIGKSILYESHP